MVNFILNKASYLEVFGLTLAYFIVLYFGVGYVFLWLCTKLEKMGILNKISTKEIPTKQLRFEILHSLKSIFIFGLSGIPVIWLYRNDFVHFLPNTLPNILIGLVILNLYNELHFFVVHRMMHLPYFMKKIHWVHHQSRIPTIQSVYSFHWIEATLLSTVPLTIIPFFDFAALAVGIYPLTSILLNLSGHCNYRFGNGKGNNWQLLGTNHHHHHSKGKQNFGFAVPILDSFLTKLKKNENNKRSLH